MVLEVGCGTGQLTERLAGFGFSLTAIDIGPSMIATARRRLDGSAVSFQVASFEDFAAADACFDLIVSGTAFHRVDPEVKFCKSARLLRPGGRRGSCGSCSYAASGPNWPILASCEFETTRWSAVHKRPGMAGYEGD